MIDRKGTTLAAELLALAVADSLPEFWYAYADRNPSAERLQFDGAEGVSFGLPHPLFNEIFRTDPHLDAARIAPIREAMNARGLPWCWCGLPSTHPGPLTDALPLAGLTPRFTMPGMTVDLMAMPDDAPDTGRQVEEVHDLAGVEAFASAILPAYDMPAEFAAFFTEPHSLRGFYPDFPVRIFYGVHEGVPVAGSLVFFGRQVAAIQCVGTRPEARGRGYATAVVTACLRAARDEGYRYAALHASEMGYPIYCRLGFVTQMEQGFYAPAEP